MKELSKIFENVAQRTEESVAQRTFEGVFDIDTDQSFADSLSLNQVVFKDAEGRDVIVLDYDEMSVTLGCPSCPRSKGTYYIDDDGLEIIRKIALFKEVRFSGDVMFREIFTKENDFKGGKLVNKDGMIISAYMMVPDRKLIIKNATIECASNYQREFSFNPYGEYRLENVFIKQHTYVWCPTVELKHSSIECKILYVKDAWYDLQNAVKKADWQEVARTLKIPKELKFNKIKIGKRSYPASVITSVKYPGYVNL